MLKKIIYFVFINLLFSQSDIDLEKISGNQNLDQVFDQIEILEDESVIASSVPKFDYEELDINISEDTTYSYFGYEYFVNQDKLLNIDNIPVPNSYVLGPGDEIVISIWGKVQTYDIYTVDRSGNVFIDDIGQVSLSGLTIKDAKQYLLSKYVTIYSTLKKPDETTYFDLSLGNLKSINVNIIGEVNQPGYYSIHPFSTITMSLILNGGVKESGSLRKIQVIRDGELVHEFDFYSYLLMFDNPNDFQLKNNDIVYVPYRLSNVIVEGAINKPGIYELRENEYLSDLFSYCGNLRIDASGMVEINRIISYKDRDNQDNSYLGYIVEHQNADDFLINDGDSIFVRTVGDNNNYVNIYGQVVNPGKYPYFEDLSLLDLLVISGGINDYTFNKSMSLSNVEIIRIKEDSYYPEIQIIDVNKIINNQIEDVKLSNLDYISVKKNPKFTEPEVVVIEGEVTSPGYYAISSSNETIEAVIAKAGGLTDIAYKDGIQMFRDNKQVILKSGLDIKLLDEDRIIIPKRSGTITVQGEVYNPGLVQFIDNKSLRYYINSSGGFNKNADKNDITVLYANGDIRSKTFFNKPSITDGCTIIVHKKEESIPINRTELISNIASIITSLSTIIYIIDQNSE